jgi:flavodoxin/NAD-dependent dihydropyrimidine dehydrogenase PreA subunit
MNITIFYFSGTGNTWWTSLVLKKELEQSGSTVNMYSLENPILKNEEFVEQKIKDSDHIIIGYPIYGSGLPDNMRDFIDHLPHVSDNKKFSTFCTQASSSGDGNIFFKKEIEKKGYKFLQSFQISLTTNFNVAKFPFSMLRPARGKKLETIKAKVSKKLSKMAEKIVRGEQYFEGTRLDQRLLGNIQRYIFQRNKKKLTQGFKFFKDRCTKCNLCVKTCPTENLFLDLADLDLKRKDNCLLCFRCYNFCPGLAINYGKNIKNPESYKRYPGPIENLKISEIRK